MKKALTIAGSDCSGGAGIQADLKTFSAQGIFGMSVITSVVAENTARVISYQDISSKVIKEQMDAVFEDIIPDAVKVGMLSSTATMMAVKESLQKWVPTHIVLDPVMYAKNGSPLMDPKSIDTLISEILPLGSLITPNIPEAEKISKMNIETIQETRNAAQKIYQLTGVPTLIKGGHRIEKATDILFDGDSFYEFSSERIDTKNTHGTGCTYSSAIASNLALEYTLNYSIKYAKEYVTKAIKHGLSLGKGNGPTHHFYELYKNGLEKKG